MMFLRFLKLLFLSPQYCRESRVNPPPYGGGLIPPHPEISIDSPVTCQVNTVIIPFSSVLISVTKLLPGLYCQLHLGRHFIYQAIIIIDNSAVQLNMIWGILLF